MIVSANVDDDDYNDDSSDDAPYHHLITLSSSSSSEVKQKGRPSKMCADLVVLVGTLNWGSKCIFF